VCVALLLPLTLVLEPTAFNLAHEKFLVSLLLSVIGYNNCHKL